MLPCNEAVKQHNPDQSMNNTPDTTADYKALTLKREFLRKEFSDLYALRNGNACLYSALPHSPVPQHTGQNAITANSAWAWK